MTHDYRRIIRISLLALIGLLVARHAHAIPLKFDIVNGKSSDPNYPLVVDVLLDGGGALDIPLYQMALAVEGQDQQGDYVAVTLDDNLITSYQTHGSSNEPNLTPFNFDFTALSGSTPTIGGVTTKPTGSFELRFDIVLENLGTVTNVVHFDTAQENAEVMAGLITSKTTSFVLPVTTKFTDPQLFDPDMALFSARWTADFAPVPITAAGWLFGSGVLGLIGIARRKKVA